MAWLLLSAPRAVFMSNPMSGNITERLLGAGTGPTVPSAHRLLTSSSCRCLAESRGTYPQSNMGQGEFPPGPCILLPRQMVALLRYNTQESSSSLPLSPEGKQNCSHLCMGG